jgi:N-dimethylarginine dimethylaminohydrolase
MIKINSNTGFQKLQSCLVGQCYPPEFFAFIKNSRLRSIFEKIATETEEDYQRLIRILHQHNVTTHRPTISNDFGMYLYADLSGVETYLRPPMQPRDNMIVIGDKLYVIHLGYGDGFIDPWDSFVEQVDPSKVQDYRTKNATWKKVSPPCITRVGKDLYFDFYSHDPTYHRNDYFELLQNNIIPNNFDDYRVHYVDCGGHSDSVFAVVCPGLIVTYEEPSKYVKSFPGWEIVQVPHAGWKDNDLGLQALKNTGGKWWIKDHEFDQELVDFVGSKLDNWTGYSIETVFDVNLLMIDENNAVINSENAEVISALNRYGITAHICPLRHRFFWDCGLHCATLDINRSGGMIDYFS